MTFAIRKSLKNCVSKNDRGVQMYCRKLQTSKYIEYPLAKIKRKRDTVIIRELFATNL